MHCNRQPVHNELTLYVQWNNIFFQTASSRIPDLTLTESFFVKSILLVKTVISSKIFKGTLMQI